MLFSMAIEANLGEIILSKTYSHDDVIWKKEPEKRTRQMLADVRREIEARRFLSIPNQGNGTISVSHRDNSKFDLTTVKGCRALAEDTLLVLINHSDNITQEQMTIRG